MTIHLYDGLNVIRRALDTDPLGRAPRSLFLRMATTPGIHVWCFEGAGSLNERRKLLPSYKDRPSTMTDGFHAMVDLIREVFTHTPAIQVQVRGYEADDAIASIVKRYAGADEILIHTTDKDLNALCEFPGVKTTANPIPNCEPKFVTLYKTLVGDRSDRIPGIRGFGDKTWELCQHDKLLLAFHRLLEGAPDTQRFLDAGVPERLANKIVEQADEVKTYWDVVSLRSIPDDVLTKSMKQGTLNFDTADQLLTRYRQ